MRYMHNVKQRSDVFKMPGIPRTLHLWQEMYRERSITRGRNPFINLNKCDPWKGSAVNGFPDWLLPLRIHVKVKHSLAGCFGCFNSSNTAWKHETNHQDWLCFSGWRNGCDFQGKSIQDFLMHALPVHTWIETQNELMICGEPLTERKVTVLWEGTFYHKVQWIWMFWSASTGKYLLYCATMSQLLVKPTMRFKCQECCHAKGNLCYLSTMCVWSRDNPSIAVHSGHLNFFRGVT